MRVRHGTERVLLPQVRQVDVAAIEHSRGAKVTAILESVGEDVWVNDDLRFLERVVLQFLEALCKTM